MKSFRFILFLLVVVNGRRICDPFERYDVAKSCDNRNGDHQVTCEFTSDAAGSYFELIYANGMQETPLDDESIRLTLRRIFSHKFGFTKRNETIWDWSFYTQNPNNEKLTMKTIVYVDPGNLVNIETLNGICGAYALRTGRVQVTGYGKLTNPVVRK